MIYPTQLINFNESQDCTVLALMFSRRRFGAVKFWRRDALALTFFRRYDMAFETFWRRMFWQRMFRRRFSLFLIIEQLSLYNI